MQEETKEEEQTNSTEILNQKEADKEQIGKLDEDSSNHITSEQEKEKKAEKNNAKNDSNNIEPKVEKTKETKPKNAQDKGKETTAENQKEKKQKRLIKEILGLNIKKEVIVVFKDSSSPEIVKMEDMKSNYPRDLLTFYESKFHLVDENNKTDTK